MSSFASPSSSLSKDDTSTPSSSKKSRTRQKNRTPRNETDGTTVTPSKGTSSKGNYTKGASSKFTPLKVKNKKNNNNLNSGSGTPSSSSRNNNRIIYIDYVSQQDLPTYCIDKVIIFGKFRGVTTSRRSGYITPSQVRLYVTLRNNTKPT